MRDLSSEIRAFVDTKAPAITIDELRSPYIDPMPRFAKKPRDKDPWRRPNRRLWATAACALIVVVVAVAVLAEPWRTETSSEVSSGASREVSGAPSLPLLGFAGQPLVAGGYEPGIRYTVQDVPAGPNSAVLARLDVSSRAVPSKWGPASVGLAGTVVVAGEEIPVHVKFSGPEQTILVAKWKLAAGARAELSASRPTQAAAEEALRPAATRITELSKRDFVAALSPGGPSGQNLTPLVPRSSKKLVLQQSWPRSEITVVVPKHGRKTVTIEVTGPMFADPDEPGLDAPGAEFDPEAVDVRGTTGYLLRRDASPTSGPIFALTWLENDQRVSVSTNHPRVWRRLVNFAETLREPSADEWAALLFP